MRDTGPYAGTGQGGIQVTGTDFRSFAVTSLAAIAALSSTALIAQTTDAQTDSDIVVEAPRPVPVPTPPSLPPAEQNSYTGAPLIVTTVRLSVLYSDLNLKNPADADRLMTRIDHIAQDACKYLDRLYPLSADPDCFQKSVGKAKAAAKDAIAAANK
jgi:UrcA family protein